MTGVLEHLPDTLLLVHLSKNYYGRTFEFNALVNAFINGINTGTHNEQMD
jgi:hypothetical protein